MSLTAYFTKLIAKVESSEDITNAGKDESGFYKPKKTILLRHLNLLKDLHGKPLAREQLKNAWAAVVAELPPEWLILNEKEKQELKKIMSES